MMIERIKKYIKDIELSFYLKINEYWLENQKKVLINSLKSIGQNYLLQMPICITGGENVELGDDVSIAAYVHMWGEGGIKIGSRVMIASHTAITSLTHDYQQENMHKTLVQGSITIEDDVWIGSHSIILPGISIGKGAVVGAGSVVTKDIQPYSIVFGNPARHYKFREIFQH